MTMTGMRVLVAVAAILFSQGTSVAQLPTAPPPHPTLNEVVKEYLRLGLPLPPANAELVRIDLFRNAHINDEPVK